MSAPDASPLAAALDALIPGDADWPAASQAVDPETVRNALAPDDRAWLDAFLRPAADWPAIWSGAQAHPTFSRLLHALYDAYYSAPATALRLRALSGASPRDPDSRFDPALLRNQRNTP
jgi:hypothetical protein